MKVTIRDRVRQELAGEGAREGIYSLQPVVSLSSALSTLTFGIGWVTIAGGRSRPLRISGRQRLAALHDIIRAALNRYTCSTTTFWTLNISGSEVCLSAGSFAIQVRSGEFKTELHPPHVIELEKWLRLVRGDFDAYGSIFAGFSVAPLGSSLRLVFEGAGNNPAGIYYVPRSACRDLATALLQAAAVPSVEAAARPAGAAGWLLSPGEDDHYSISWPEGRGAISLNRASLVRIALALAGQTGREAP